MKHPDTTQLHAIISGVLQKESESEPAKIIAESGPRLEAAMRRRLGEVALTICENVNYERSGQELIITLRIKSGGL
jgi:hypothetical protein